MKIKILLLFLFISICLSSIYYFFFRKPVQSEVKKEAAQQTEAKKSLREILVDGETMECTYENDFEKGILYTAGGKAKGKFSTKDVVSFMIIRDSFVYLWIDGNDEGVIIPNSMLLYGNTSNIFTPNPDALLDYECTPWEEDPHAFDLPDINFIKVDQVLTPTN